MQGRETGRVEGGGGLAGDASSRRVVLVRGEGAGEGEVRRGEGRRGKARQGVCVMQVCIRLYAEPRCSDRNGWMWMWMWMWMGWDGLLCWLLAWLLACWLAWLLACWLACFEATTDVGARSCLVREATESAC
jgi:hypothetical protein